MGSHKRVNRVLPLSHFLFLSFTHALKDASLTSLYCALVSAEMVEMERISPMGIMGLGAGADTAALGVTGVVVVPGGVGSPCD